MSREWKPGDVALAKYEDEDPKVYLRISRRNGDDERWESAEGMHSYNFSAAEWWRPLVVIDPEDPEQVERLYDLYANVTPAGTRGGDFMRAALREFANPTPPKPDEPTRFAAAVMDKEGRSWVRGYQPGCGDNGRGPWFCGDLRSHYADIDAVRVLSEGVQP